MVRSYAIIVSFTALWGSSHNASAIFQNAYWRLRLLDTLNNDAKTNAIKSCGRRNAWNTELVQATVVWGRIIHNLIFITNKQFSFFYPQSISLKTNCKKLAVFLIRLNGWALPRLFVSSYLDDYMEKQEMILQNLYVLHNRLLWVVDLDVIFHSSNVFITYLTYMYFIAFCY